ncbi:fused MFS/spermidine synthase [Candidatus Chloroploca sp. M-50]|uniref:Fused MFS/spermidine synthase n=1 Tax=Candidatus Chloroploca mongolica TaxID=2528176 RepID=A0ABS4D7Y2_9CHLR|nr:fused MFS/spermidine synthase [Candidatus Chloroploca mongolica]MBP1465532.1 fused MFS/spermidine synthase [Candidatus Chloroploca mongolica]
MARRDRFLLVVVFLAGVGTLGIEMVMPRLLAPFFGTSQPIWAVVIGMTLAYLAVGYWLGGRLADRYPDERLLYWFIAWAGLLCAVIPLVARPVLLFAQGALRTVAAGGFLGALLVVLLLFAAPVILMATVGPFAVRLRLREAGRGVEEAGRTAGTISALSTVGSIVGTFLTVLLLMPLIGASATLFLFAAFLIVLAFVGLRDWRVGIMLAVVAALFGLHTFNAGNLKRADCGGCRLLAERESNYNYIQVAEQEVIYQGGRVDPRRVLMLNEGQALHSIYRLRYRETGNPLDLLTDGGPWDYFTVAPFVYADKDPQHVQSFAMLGSAAGSIPKQFLAIYGPQTRIDAVEIDGRIVELGRRYFDLEDRDPAFPFYTTYVADARYWLATTDQQYDVIGMDAYHQPYIPFHLTTVEFFTEVKERLNPQGVAVVNAGRPASGDDRLVNALGSTMLAVFPEVYVIDTRFANAILIGVNTPAGDGVTNFRRNADAIATLAETETQYQALQLVMYWSLNEGRFGPVRPFTPTQARFTPFTDDLAPVERLIDGLILREAIGGS